MNTPRSQGHDANTPPPADKWGDADRAAQDLVSNPSGTGSAADVAPDPFAKPVSSIPDIHHGDNGQAAFATDYADEYPDPDRDPAYTEHGLSEEKVSDYFPWDDIFKDPSSPAAGPHTEPTTRDTRPDEAGAPNYEPKPRFLSDSLFQRPEDPKGRDNSNDPVSAEPSKPEAYPYPEPEYDVYPYNKYAEEPDEPEEPLTFRRRPAVVETVIESPSAPAVAPFKDERGRLRRSLDYFRPSQWMAKAAVRKVAKNWDREASEVSGREVWEKAYTPRERKIFRWAEGIGGLYGVMAIGTVAIKSIPSLRFIGEHLEGVGDSLGFDGQFGPGSGAKPHFEQPSASPSGSRAAPGATQHPTPHSSGRAPSPGVTEAPKSTPTTTGGPKPTTTGTTTAPAPGTTAGTGAAGSGGEQAGGGTAGLGAAEEQTPTVTAIPEHIELTVENRGMHKGDGSWILSERHLTEAAKAAGIDPDTLTDKQVAEVQKAFLEDKGNAGKFYGDGRMNLLDKDGNPIVYEGHDAAVKIASILEDIKNGGNGNVVEPASTNANAEPNLQPNPNGQAVDTTVQGEAVPGINEGRMEDVIINVENGDDWDAIFDKIDFAASAEDRDKLIHDPRFQEVMGKSGFNIGYKEGNDYRVRMPHQGDNGTHPLPQGAVEEILDQYYRLLDEEEDEDATA